MTTHEEKYSKCNKCEYKAKTHSDLRAHREEEHPPFIHNCGFCDFTTKHNNQLEKHIRLNHSEEFQCNMCPFRARDKWDLNNHKNRKHAPEYPCEFCVYRAFSNADLSRHIRVMHKDKQQTLVYNRTGRKNIQLKSQIESWYTT